MARTATLLLALLERGRMSGGHPRAVITFQQLTTEMAGGSDLAELTRELRGDT